MKLLVITEKLDQSDESALYFEGMLRDLAARCTLTVMVLENRSHALPKEANVVSLGKERGVSRVGYLLNFYRFVFGHAGAYDAVLVHRNPVYVVLGGVFWRLMGKRVTLWYNHAYRDWQLSLAAALANRIISPSSSGFPFKTKKLRVVSSERLAEEVCTE